MTNILEVRWKEKPYFNAKVPSTRLLEAASVNTMSAPGCRIRAGGKLGRQLLFDLVGQA
jgi:hypothetical protein